jgi:uncharacterized membrane protein YbhN (UPF0104 family)
MTTRRRLSKRRWLFWLLLAAFAWLVVSRFTEIETLVTTLGQGRWPWILLAALLQVGYYVLYAALFQVAFHTVGVESRTRDLLPVTLGAVFINTVAPSGGTAGLALFVDDAARQWAAPGAGCRRDLAGVGGGLRGIHCGVNHRFGLLIFAS